MQNPILQTKLHTPALRANLIPRTSLVQKLNSGVGEDSTMFSRKITLVSAPPGFGKTTLVTEWLAQQDRPIAWVAINEDDSNPQQFFEYVALAVQAIDGVGQSLSSLLQSQQVVPARSMAVALINDATNASSQFLLILDDYHLINSVEIDQALAFLLNHMPPRMHLVMTSRRDPGFPLSQLRAQNQLTEIRAEDLRFTVAETSAFLQQSMGLSLSSAQIAALESRTEGWIAGLQMAALSMQNRDDVAGFIATFAGDDRYVIDYLMDEVLAQQSEISQSFLLQTSILSRLTGPLCDALTGRADGQDMLARLEQANLFVVALDNRREWYRYHHLFADMLQHRLRQSMPDSISDLHRRASEWYEIHEDVGQALRHARAAGDVERAANIIGAVGLRMIVESRLARLLGWIDMLPPELIAERPWICVSGAWANLLTGQLENVDSLLRLSDAFLSRSSSKTLAETDQILGHATAIRAFLARWREGDIARSIALSNEASQNVPQENQLLHSALALNQGNGYQVLGEMKAAAACYEESRSVARKAGMHYVALAASSSLGQVQAEQGHLHQAARTCRQTIQLGAEWGGGQPLPATGYAHIVLGQVLYEWNELDEALIQIARGIELGEQANELSMVLSGTFMLFELKHAQGDVSAASEVLTHAHEILADFTRAQESSQLSAYQVLQWLAQDNWAAISGWVKEHNSIIAGGEVQHAQMPEYLALSRVFIEMGREKRDRSSLHNASSLLARLLDKAVAAGWTGNTILILALQALAFHAQGELEQALMSLGQALSLGESEGFTRIFLNEGAPMAFLLSQLEKHPYATHLLNAFPTSIPATATPQSNSSLVEPLSDRELDVLRLMADGIKYREIADQLFVSLNTVRSHMKNIYGKLGVNNRTQALAKARALHLL